MLLLGIGPLASAEGARLLLVAAGAVILTLGLAAACGSQVLERRGRAVERYRGPSPVLVFLTYLMAFTVIGTVRLRERRADPTQPFGFLAVGSLQAIGYAVLVWLFVVRTEALSSARDRVGRPGPAGSRARSCAPSGRSRPSCCR